MTKLEEFQKNEKVQQTKRFIIKNIRTICCVGMIAFLILHADNRAAQLLALAESALCAGCIFFAFRQHHTLSESVSIAEPSSVRYDI